ncbi:MAG: HupE/UreJ family protein [Myxococcota bacterium]
MTRFRSLLAVPALLGTLSLPATAAAHMGSTKSLDVRVTPGGAQVEARVDGLDAALALGLGRSLDASDLQRHEGLLAGWLTRGIAVGSDAGPCAAEAGPPALEDEALVVGLRFDCPSEAGLVLRDDTIFADEPDHEVFVTVRHGEAAVSGVLRAEARTLSLDADTSARTTAGAFVRDGIVHLVTGWDHLLFLLSLLLIAGLTSKRDGLEAALRDVGWIVTAFTLGHSVSLCAAALGWVVLPSAWVEAAIAASIIVVAGMNVARPEAPTRSTARRRARLAATFGLIHGFGFSSVLADVGLPDAHRVLALLCFNLGIELGQVAAVLAVLVPLTLWAQRPSYRRYAVQAGSCAIGACGCIWLVERTLLL